MPSSDEVKENKEKTADPTNPSMLGAVADFEDYQKVDKWFNDNFPDRPPMAWLVPLILILVKKNVVRKSDLKTAMAFFESKIREAVTSVKLVTADGKPTGGGLIKP